MRCVHIVAEYRLMRFEQVTSEDVVLCGRLGKQLTGIQGLASLIGNGSQRDDQ
jgi:hypothetical protein